MHANQSKYPSGWYAVAKSQDIKAKPISVDFFATSIVLWRHQNGIGAIEDRCPHRNAPLSKGKICEGHIQCPYHGWQFNQNGHCHKIPGREKPLTDNTRLSIPYAHVLERSGIVFINWDSVDDELYIHPITKQGGHYSFLWSSMADGTVTNVAENFLDGFHTHYVHSGLIRRDSKRQSVNALIKRTADRVEIDYLGETKQNGWISKLFEKDRATSHAKFILPNIAELEYRSKKRTELVITVHLTKSMEDQVLIHTIITIPGGVVLGSMKRLMLTPFFYLVLRQDKKILSMQQENIAKFGKSNFHSTSLDVMRPHIDDLTKNGSDPKKITTKEVQLLL